jgi:pimeloyl-ACP methyl ester carboxylesterase
MAEELQTRIHGSDSLPTLVYLPGLHGDWTLVGRFRKALGGRVRFVEVTYPRTLTWSLEDYAAGVETELAQRGIIRGWLLGESFSSQVVWALLSRKRFQAEGVILAGGFVRHPMTWGVRVAEYFCGAVSLGLLTRILFGYARIARLRYRHSPDARAALDEFLARRTKLDQQAAKHRLHLLAQNDPCEIAKAANVPVYAITGLFDPIVPWFWVRRWLKRNCPALREYRIIARSDHNVLGNAAETTAEHVLAWMGASRQGDKSKRAQADTRIGEPILRA